MRQPIQRILTACLLLGAIHSGASASGVSPYLPLHLSPEIERQIERVLILADKPTMTRPIAAATVIDALPAACKVDEALCRRVRRYLDRLTRPAGIGDISLTAAASDGDPIALGNSYGMTSDSAWQVAAHGYWQPNPYVYLSLGGVAYEDAASPTGSVLSLGFEYAQLDIGYREHWLSPFTEHAMLISTQAKTLPSITLSNYAPITRLGLRYELFFAEMELSDRIETASGFTSGEPGLAGLHLALEPGGAGWSLAANRLAQFGGGERSRSFSDFFNALIDPEEFDERGNIDLSNEFGNQLAAWTAQFVFPVPVPFTTYLEYGGEDRSYEGNYRSFSNAAMSFGIAFPRLWHGMDLTYEVSEWQNFWYIHTIYRGGLTEGGHILGHWGAEARIFNDRVGAQSHLVRVGWEPSWGGLLQVRARTVENEKFPRPPAGIEYERAYDLAVSYSRAINGFTAGTQVMAGRDIFGESFARLDGFVRFGDEWAGDIASASVVRDSSRETGAELFVDAGLNANEVLVTLDAVSATRSGVRTDREVAPHFAVGARRAVSPHQDLGVRVELDRIQDTLLIGLRALDYRYRFDGPIALSVFLGAARYDLATPAMGYYGGVGVQWRDALPRVDIGLDARYADKIERDKLLPGEPRNVRPDSFYDISSVTLYASYKW